MTSLNHSRQLCAFMWTELVFLHQCYVICSNVIPSLLLICLICLRKHIRHAFARNFKVVFLIIETTFEGEKLQQPTCTDCPMHIRVSLRTSELDRLGFIILYLIRKPAFVAVVAVKTPTLDPCLLYFLLVLLSLILPSRLFWSSPLLDPACFFPSLWRGLTSCSFAQA